MICYKRELSVSSIKIALVIIVGLTILSDRVFAQTNDIPRLQKKGDATQLIVDGKPYVMLGGELHNSSATSLEYTAPTWAKLAGMNINTALVALTWETIEPVEGKFDFTLIDGIIAQARQENIRLVFLWFASWKNASTTYPPAWVKTNLKRFPRTQDSEGTNLEHISVFSENAWTADAKAFAAVMKHIREIDSYNHTVIAMQVQNESGLIGEARDRSKLANVMFSQQVPEELTGYLVKNLKNLGQVFDNIWGANNYRREGTWSEVFGADADEVFMTWYNAKYIDKVTEAGKAEYPLPMFANAWQNDGITAKAGEYPSGGPVAKMIPVWQAAAPHIDVLAPDIYLDDFTGICDKYVTMGNPLLVPEARADVANAFYAFAEHDAICFAPFGIDGPYMSPDNPLWEGYGLLRDLMPFITQYHGTGKMIAVQVKRGEKREVELGDYNLVITYLGVRGRSENETPGYGLIIALDDGSYLAAGVGYQVMFESKSKKQPRTAILSAHEMIFSDGEWIQRRWFNGDETGFPPFENSAGIRMRDTKSMVQRATIYRHE